MFLVLISLNAFAGTAYNPYCNNINGLNLCVAEYDLSSEQEVLFNENLSKFHFEIQAHAPIIKIGITKEELNKIGRHSGFKDSTSFQDYMRSVRELSSNNETLYSLRSKILINKKYGLECRITSIDYGDYSSLNFSDCTLRLYF